MQVQDMKNNPELSSFMNKVFPFFGLIFIAFVCTITCNNVCRFAEIRMKGENDYVIVEQGIWMGHVDKDEISENCVRYRNNPFDSNWHVSRAFSAISQLLTVCVFILSCELMKFNYGSERRVMLAVTCLEIAFAQGMTLLFISSSRCMYMNVPGQFDEASLSCHYSSGFFITVFTIPMWTLAGALSMHLPIPSEKFSLDEDFNHLSLT